MDNKAWRVPIDIFVICYQRTPLLECCLESIHKCTTNIEHNVIVIEGKRSAAENRNIALSKVTSPWFVMMDDDVIVTSGWLDTLLKYADDKVGQIQPKLLFPNKRIFSAEMVFIAPWGGNKNVGMGGRDRGQFDYIRIAELLVGTCCLYNSGILSDCIFDTNYEGTQWEDCDFSMQIRNKGYYLLYCGTSEVYHHNLYRNPVHKNYNYFKNKWFGKRALCKRGVLYVEHTCDLNCVFYCYKHEKKRAFQHLQELKEECDKFVNFYGNTCVDITGGEPMIYPKIIQLVEHCKKINLIPTIITNGQRLTAELVEKLKQAGLEDFLIPYHGLEKEYNYLIQKADGYSLMRCGLGIITKAGLTFRTNTVVTKINYRTLPDLAREFLEAGQKVANFIMFNPLDEGVNFPKQDLRIRYSETAPYLMEAISILNSKGIEVHVKYMPFCLFPGLEKYIINFPQMPFDQWGWRFKRGYPLDNEYNYLYSTLKESRASYSDNCEPCQKCSLKLICSGLPKQYIGEFGWNELKPHCGMVVRDPLYFMNQNEQPVPDSNSVKHLSDYPVRDLIKAYPYLKHSDPLIFHQVASLKGIMSLRRESIMYIKGVAKLGRQWLNRRLQSPKNKDSKRGGIAHEKKADLN